MPMPTATKCHRNRGARPDHDHRQNVAAEMIRAAADVPLGACSLSPNMSTVLIRRRPDKRDQRAANEKRRSDSADDKIAPRFMRRPQARVNGGIGQIDQKVHADHGEDQQHDDAFDDDQIALADAWNTNRPRPGRKEHLLDDDAARQQKRKLQAHESSTPGSGRCAARVATGLATAQPFGAGGAHEILVQHVQQGRPHDPRQNCRLRQGQRSRARSATSCRRQKPFSHPGKPPAENQRRLMAKTSTSIIANQKFGTATPSCVAPMTPISPALATPAGGDKCPPEKRSEVLSASA